MGTPMPPNGGGQITGGDFSYVGDWLYNPPWTISTGKARAVWPPLPPFRDLWQLVDLIPGVTYWLKFDMLFYRENPGSALQARLGGPGGPVTPLLIYSGSYAYPLTFNDMGDWLVFYIWGAQVGSGYCYLDNVEMGNVVTWPAKNLSLFTQSQSFYDDLDLGNGYHNTRYASNFDKSNVLVAYDSDDF